MLTHYFNVKDTETGENLTIPEINERFAKRTPAKTRGLVKFIDDEKLRWQRSPRNHDSTLAYLKRYLIGKDKVAILRSEEYILETPPIAIHYVQSIPSSETNEILEACLNGKLEQAFVYDDKKE